MRSLDIDDDLVPKNARKIALLAREHMWTVQITHVYQSDGVSNVAVRMADLLVPRSAWAVWLDGQFKGAACSNPFAAMNQRDLKQIITEQKASP